MRPPPIFWVFNSPSPRPPGADGHHRGRGHVGRYCPYTNNIWCGSVQALLRYRSKTVKMQKFPIDSHSNENSFAPFSARRGPPTPKLPGSRPWCLLYPEPKFHADRTILRWDILNRTNKQKKANLILRQTLRFGEIIITKYSKSNNSRVWVDSSIDIFGLKPWRLLAHKFLSITAACAVAWYPSARLSVTFMYFVVTNKCIFRISSYSPTILVFPHQTLWQYSDGDPLIGALSAGGVGKIAILDQCLAFRLMTRGVW